MLTAYNMTLKGCQVIIIILARPILRQVHAKRRKLSPHNAEQYVIRTIVVDQQARNCFGRLYETFHSALFVSIVIPLSRSA